MSIKAKINKLNEASQDPSYELKLFVKFKLGGGQQPKDFRTKILIPKLKVIKGFIVYNIGGVDQVAK